MSILSQPWNNLLIPIELQAEKFWSDDIIYRSYVRRQDVNVWKNLRNKIVEVTSVEGMHPLSDVEIFLLHALAYLYEVGWQQPDGPNLTIQARYESSCQMILDSFTRKRNAKDFGLNSLPSELVGALAQVCGAIGKYDLSELENAPIPVGYEDLTVRPRYVAALFQLADAMLIDRLRKLPKYPDLQLPAELADLRIMLRPIVPLCRIIDNIIKLQIRLHPDDLWLAIQLEAIIDDPFRQWSWNNQDWLCREFSYVIERNISKDIVSEGLNSFRISDNSELLSKIEDFDPHPLPPHISRESCRQMFIDFEIVVEDGKIRAKSEQGERESSLTLSQNDWEQIRLTMQLIEANNTTEILLRDFGSRLYNILFNERINSHFIQTEAVARRESKSIRIRLTIASDKLATIPWEFTFREEGGYYLSVNPNTVLSHYIDMPLPRNRVRQRTGVLDMLVLISKPKDQNPVETEPGTWEKIISQPLEGENIRLRFAKAEIDSIRDAILEYPPDIVQFIGHGIYRNNKGYLALENAKGLSDLVDDVRFANIFLGGNDKLGLVCLAACESGRSDALSSFSGIAPQLVQRGIPAVVAMRYPILISSAEIFFADFYKAVAARKPVDWALQWARNAVATKRGMSDREFATPVLYMRAEDGKIF